MLIVSTPTISGGGFDEAQSMGFVAAQAYCSTAVLQSLPSPLQDGKAYSSIDLASELSGIQQNLLSDLVRQARQLGANSIVAVRLHHQSIVVSNEAKLMVSMDGTAVQLRSR